MIQIMQSIASFTISVKHIAAHVKKTSKKPLQIIRTNKNKSEYFGCT